MTLLVRYDVGVRKNFNRTNVPVYTKAIPTRQWCQLWSCDRAMRFLTVVWRMATLSVDFSVSNALLVAWAPHPLITLSVFGGVINAFKYAIADSVDAYTSPYAHAGLGRQDEMRTNIDVTVNLPLRHISFLSGGVFTVSARVRSR